MDTMFMNRISTEIHKQCVTRIINDGLYESDPVSFRRRVEDCFQNCIAQQQHVEKGMQKYFVLKGVNMWIFKGKYDFYWILIVWLFDCCFWR